MNQINSPSQTHCPVRPCSYRGCDAPSNGIAPYYKCSTHYRVYMEWLGRRDELESSLTMLCTPGVPEILAGEPRISEELASPVSTQAHVAARVGALLDHLGQTAARSIYAARSTNEKGHLTT